MITLESSGKNLFKSSNKAFIYQTKNALFLITAFDNFSAFSSNSSIIRVFWGLSSGKFAGATERLKK